MYKYLIIYPDHFETYLSDEIFRQTQVIEINGSKFTSEVHHCDNDGPYGVLINECNPVGHSRIMEVIRRANVQPLPVV
ncbi:hypothetical protein PRCB_17705 [Pantoea rodasii]|uniref:Uncharacterized protein n=1 Tax=Pantoea rodasii TaxID=1076549 RepID=A0A2M9W9A1_9GAMM|nr:hypothetical protein HA45_12850 [Pantoea rodasii]PJZ04111.1 hypothetical protein PRCB_17705 [Pantoea rodasii]